MKNRFKKVLSMLIIIALLVSSIVMVFAEEENVPAIEEQIVETTGAEGASNEEAAPAQEEASIIVEASTDGTAPAAEEASNEETAPAQEETSIVVEASTDGTAPAAEEASNEETVPAQAEAAAEEPTPAVEENKQEDNNTVEETPAETEETSEVSEETSNEEGASKEAEAPAEDVIPAEEVEEEIPSEEADIINEETASEDGEEEFIDELADDTTEYSEEDTQELGDDAGYIDPEVVDEHIPEITAEMKYEDISELKIGGEVKGQATTEENGVYFIKPAQTRHIVLGLTTEANVKVIINDKEVRFVPDETIENFSWYEMNAKAGNTYIIQIVADNASFILTAEYKAEAQEEEIAEIEETEETEVIEETEATEETEAEATEAEATENTEATEEQSVTPAAEDEDAKVEEEIIETEEVVPAEDNNNEETLIEEKEETENTEATEEQSVTPAAEEETAEVKEETIEEVVPAEDNINEETLTEETEETKTLEHSNTKTLESEEETIPTITAWIETETEEYAIGDQITLKANANTELRNAIGWQTSVDGEEWNKVDAPYAKTLTIDVTEENANSFYRFKIADGIFSEAFQLAATEKAEEVAEEESKTSEPEIEGEEIKDVESETEEEIEEKTEEETIEPLTDEEMLAMGYIKVFVAMDIGANIYGDITENAEAIDHLDVGTEMWVKLIDGADRAAIYSEEENETAYINLVDLIAIMKPEDVEELPTRYIEIHSNLEGYDFVYYGTTEILTVTMDGFQEDDNYTIQWKYSADNGESYSDIDGANDAEYMYVINEENYLYAWKVVINLQPKEIVEEE